MRHPMLSQAWCLLSIAFAAMPGAVLAAPPSSVYPDDSDTGESMIRSAQANMRDKQWAEASDIYRRAMKDYGDKAIRLPDEFRTDRDFVQESRRWVNLREFVIAQLAEWPEEGREAFRKSTDAEASRIWSRAVAEETDPVQARSELITLTRDLFLSSYGPRAIERLGDTAFQNGDFDEAASWYARLAPLPGTPVAEAAKTLPAVHPEPASDKALLAAKLSLARIAAGSLGPERATALLRAYAAAYPQAQGTFAGRSGSLAESLIKAVKDDGLAPAATLSNDWPTFAGAPGRNFVVGDSIDLGDRQWRAPLESVIQGPARFQGQNRFGGFGGRGGFPRNFPANPNRTTAQTLLAYHPVIVGDQVIICNDYGVMAYNLNEAPKPDEPIRLAWSRDFDRVGRNNPQQTMSSSAPRMTLTAHNGRLFARMGESGINLEFGNRMAPSNAFIVALDARNKGAVLWRLQGSQIELAQPDGAAAPSAGSIEGTPVADDERLYVAVTLPGHQTSTYVVALEADTGKPVWSRYVCDTPNPFDFQAAMLGYQASHAHHLLTLAGDRLFYQTDTGAVASLDARTGAMHWLTAYPKREQLGAAAIPPTRRDLNPVIYDEGVVYVAPSDSQNLFALDADSGAVLWKSAPLPDVIHLIGTAEGNLFATGDRVWTIEAATGRILRSWPDTGAGYEPAGRGLLAGRYLYWPTGSEIHILDQKTGLRSDRGTIRLRERFNTSGGNLVLGDGFFVVAGADSLSAFTQNTRLIRRYEQLIAAEPSAAAPRYRLATAAESLGQTDLALKALRESLKRVEPADRLDGQDLETLVRDRLFRLLLKKAADSTDKPEAVKALAEAEALTGDPVKRLAAVVRRATLTIELGDPRKALDDLATAARRMESPDGLWSIETRYDVNISDLVLRTISQAWEKLSATDRSAYSAAEGAAFSALAAKADRSALLRFLAGAVPGESRARALMSLAQSPEEATNLPLARRRLAEAASQPALAEPLRREIEALALRLTSPPVAETPTRSAWPTTAWNTVFKGFRQIVPVTDAASVSAPSDPDMMILGLSKDGATHLIDLRSGKPGPLLEEFAVSPIWAGLSAGRGLIFDGTRLYGIDPRTGQTAWRIALREADPDDPRFSPFASARIAEAAQAGRADTRRSADSEGGERLWWVIQTRGDAVVIYNFSGQYWRVDAAEGRLLWRRTADNAVTPESAEAPVAHFVGPHVIVREGTTVLVLDERTGETIRSLDGGVAGTDWSRPPMAWDDGRVVVCPDRLSVAMIDLTSGERLWTYKVTSTSPRNGPPRLFRRGDKLIVIKDGEVAVRLDPANGKPVWDVVLGDTDHSRDIPDIAVDDSRLYVIEPLDSSTIPGVAARGFDLTDGSAAWKSVHLSAGQTWAVATSFGPSGGVLIRPDNPTAQHFAAGMVQEGETFSAIPSGTIGERIRATAVILDGKTGRAERRYLAPAGGTSTPWVVTNGSGTRLLWGALGEPIGSMIERER